MKKIIHIDADCFFAAIEMRDNPVLYGHPIAVGGSPERRGVISTCNYDARMYGIHSAMPSAHAKRLCPHLHILPHRFDVYKQVSEQMREIFDDYSDKVQPLSLDEAFIDVSDSQDCQGSATLIAQEIRQRIFQATGITVSAGIAPVKYLAKIASDWNKPNGTFTVTPKMVDAFSAQLAVRRLPGVGKVTEAKMARYGLHSCQDIRDFGFEALIKIFGVYGKKLYDMSQGIDTREVCADRVRKSLSIEKTYSHNMSKMKHMNRCLPDLVIRLNERFTQLPKAMKVSKKFIKFKYHDFTLSTMECVAGRYGQAFCENDFARLMNCLWHKRQEPVRLLGLGVRFKEGHCPEQLCLNW